MSTLAPAPTVDRTEGLWVGLRMTADQFLQILDDGQNYELIDGVVVMSPSPAPKHQHVAGEIFTQLSLWLRDNRIGLAFAETDVHLGQGPTGADLVYKPEIVFIRAERLPGMEEKLVGAPDLVVEVISRGSRRFDTQTKKDDYERSGVGEYWLIDPEREALTFYRLEGGRFVEVAATGDTFASQAVPGFILDLARVRQVFKPW